MKNMNTPQKEVPPAALKDAPYTRLLEWVKDRLDALFVSPALTQETERILRKDYVSAYIVERISSRLRQSHVIDLGGFLRDDPIADPQFLEIAGWLITHAE